MSRATKDMGKSPYYPLSQTQTWLLQAALMAGDRSTQAWQQWRDCVDIETLDSASYHVLSTLYPTLSKYQVDDPHIARLKGVYRRTWYGNQLLIKPLSAVLQALAAANVEVLVLGEMALLANCYADYGERAIAQFDLLVSPAAMPEAVTALREYGWHDSNFDPAAPTPVQPDAELSAPLGFHHDKACSLWLHNHLFWAVPQTHTDAQLWENAISTEINSVSARVLSPVDLLLHLCLKINQQLHADVIQQIQKQPFYCLADATRAISAIQSEAEWVRLLAQAQRYEIILPLRYLLSDLQQLFEIVLPDWVMPNLQKMAISYHELLSYQLSPDDRSLRLKAHWVKLRQQLKANRPAIAQQV